MKAIAFITAALIFLLYITSGPVYFDMLTSKADENVFAYSDEIQENNSNVQMKPLSRGDALDRRETEIKLKLMTYNMHRGIGQDRRLNLDNTAEVIRSSNADIIALQEVERHSIRTGFQDQIKVLAGKLGKNYVYGKSMNILNGEYGNGLISAYPIEEYKVYDLPSKGEQRTILRTVVNIGGSRLAVYNTHLGLHEEERSAQLEYIMQMTAAETLDYILMGDMNTKAAKLTAVTEVMKDSAIGSEKQEQSTFVENEVQERIDYIFVSPNMEVTDYNVVISQASDHYPVVSEILIKK